MAGIYDPKHYDVHNSVAYLMGRIRVKLHEAVDRELAQYDITTAQRVVMLYVANGMADKASEICALQSYDPGAMTRMIDRLEQKGFIRRVPSPNDRRVVNLELTLEGKAVYPKILATGMSPEQSYAMLDRMINQQAFMRSADDVFYASALLFLSLIAVVWLARPAKGSAGTADAAGAH